MAQIDQSNAMARGPSNEILIELCDGERSQRHLFGIEPSLFERIGGKAAVDAAVELLYKKVDAVVKYLAYAQSLWITYLINIAMIGMA